MKKGDCIKFKFGCVWLFGEIDRVDGGWCEISYGSKKRFLKLQDGFPLNLFCDMRKEELVLIDKDANLITK